MKISMISSLITQTLIYAAPLILVSIGGIFSEKSGIINICLDGFMVIGAFSSIIFNLSFCNFFGNLTPFISCLIGGIIGAIFSILHAISTINFRANHIISGTVINLIAPAFSVFLTKILYNSGQTTMISNSFGYFNIFFGKNFFIKITFPILISILLIFLSWFIIYKTKIGLYIRAVGEEPKVADTLGIDVYLMRYIGVILSGFFAGIGGAVFAHDVVGNFSVNTISGQGFLAIAAIIFGKWNPIYVMNANLFFGLVQNLSIISENLLLLNIPSVFIQILPYLLTIIILTFFIRKSFSSKSCGINYIKSR